MSFHAPFCIPDLSYLVHIAMHAQQGRTWLAWLSTYFAVLLCYLDTITARAVCRRLLFRPGKNAYLSVTVSKSDIPACNVFSQTFRVGRSSQLFSYFVVDPQKKASYFFFLDVTKEPKNYTLRRDRQTLSWHARWLCLSYTTMHDGGLVSGGNFSGIFFSLECDVYALLFPLLRVLSRLLRALLLFSFYCCCYEYA